MLSTLPLPGTANGLSLALPLMISLLATAVEAKGGGSKKSKQKKKKISKGALIGIIIVIVIVVLLLIIAAWFISKRKKKAAGKKKGLEGGDEMKPIEGAGTGGASQEYYGRN